MNMIIITNNNLVYENYYQMVETEYLEGKTYLQILEYVRDKIHMGHKLLTHPLSGSVKPNETPYKTIAISKEKDTMEFNDLSIIEQSIVSANKFINNEKVPLWTEKVLRDFQLIDLSLIQNAINNMHFV